VSQKYTRCGVTAAISDMIDRYDQAEIGWSRERDREKRELGVAIGPRVQSGSDLREEIRIGGFARALK